MLVNNSYLSHLFIWSILYNWWICLMKFTRADHVRRLQLYMACTQGSHTASYLCLAQSTQSLQYLVLQQILQTWASLLNLLLLLLVDQDVQHLLEPPWDVCLLDWTGLIWKTHTRRGTY